MSMSADPIDALLDQAAAAARQRLDDEAFAGIDFSFPGTTSAAAALDGTHALVEARECRAKGGGSDDAGGSGQWGVYAKRNLQAGTKVVIAKPIVTFWDAEDDDSDSEEEDGSDQGYGDACEPNGDDEIVDDQKPRATKGTENGKAGLASNKSESADDGSSNDDDGSVQAPTGTKRNGMLVLRALERIANDPSLWTDTLSKLFPRDVDAALALPPWFCGDPSVGMEIERRMKELPTLSLFPSEENNETCEENNETCEEIAIRLPLIVRYNVLSIETSSELFVYPDIANGGMASLAGTGLYGPEVSYFNHSCAPNVSRYCIGDVMFFVANRDVSTGEELCFSYIEHEYLCENAAKRSALLDMDFELKDDNANERPSKKQKVAKMPSKDEGDEPSFPLIDAEMQSELMATMPKERLDLINELLEQEADPVRDYQCDRYQLHILKAITLEGMGLSNHHRGDKKEGLEHALPEWETAIDFATKHFPPLDETTVALHVQAALCASVNAFDDWAKVALRTKGHRVGNKERAIYHANKALEMHQKLFGGDKARFLKRYVDEFMTAVNMRLALSEAQLLFTLEYLWGFGDEAWNDLVI